MAVPPLVAGVKGAPDAEVGSAALERLLTAVAGMDPAARDRAVAEAPEGVDVAPPMPEDEGGEEGPAAESPDSGESDPYGEEY